METCILMPHDLSIILLPHPDPTKIFEMGVTLWANRTIPAGRLFRPEEGSVRLDKLEVYDILPLKDIRYQFGCTDAVIQVEDREVRHCNWVRFLRSVHNPDDVNLVARRLPGGQTYYQVVKTIPANSELRAFFDLGVGVANEEVVTVDSRYSPRRAQLDLSPPTHAQLDHPSPRRAQIDQSTPRRASLEIHAPLTRAAADEKENLLLVSPAPSSIDSHSTSASSPRSDVYDDDHSTTLSSDISPASSIGIKIPKESSSDFASTPASSRGHQSKSTSDYFSSTFGSTPDKPTSPPSSLVGSPPGYGMELLTSLPDYRDMRSNPLPLRRKEKTWLPCDVCGKKFDRPSLLKRHMRTHTGEKPHACDVCGKAFSTSSSLNTHRRIHSGEKPHQCQICGKRFTASSNLYYHRMTHKKEKPHKCSMCSKSFPTPGDLKSHMYVHNGSWPFKCDVCNRGFSKQTNLKNHMLLHTGDKPHECQLCGKKFALQCNLRTHQKTHEEEPQEECVRCHRKFLANKNLTHQGVCQDCHSPQSARDRPIANGRHVNSFSIESLVSPSNAVKETPPHKSRHPVQTTPIDMSKAPFYASAMMSAGMMALHPYGNGSSPFGLGVSWPPPPPLSQRFGL